MVSFYSFIGMFFSLIVGVLAPIILIYCLRRKYQASLFSFFVGMASFFIAVQVLEGPLNMYILTVNETTSSFFMTSPWAIAMYGGLMAGLFEESARFISFKFILKKQTRIQDALAYGVGHGGIEALLIAGITSLNNIILSYLVNQNSLDTLGLSSEIMTVVTSQLTDTEPLMFFVSGIERLLTIVIHVAFSLLVYKAVRERKYGYYVLAIFLHMVLNIPAVFYQFGSVNIWLIEAYVLIFSICSLIYIIKTVKSNRSDLIEVEDEELARVKTMRY